MFIKPKAFNSLVYFLIEQENELKLRTQGRVVVIVWKLDLQLPVQSVPITTKVASSNPAHGKVYWIQYYVIKFVNDLQQVSGFFWVIQFPPPVELTATI